MRIASCLSLASALTLPAFSQTLVDWDHSGLNYTGGPNVPVANPLLPASTAALDASVSTSDLIAVAVNPTFDGLAWTDPMANGGPGQANLRYFDGDPSDTGTWHDGINDNYLSFTLTANTPGTLAIGRLSVSQWRNGSGAPAIQQFEVAVDGGPATLFGTPQEDTDFGDFVYDWFHFDGLIAGATTVEVHYVPVAAPGGLGTGNIHINGLRVEGPGGIGSAYCNPAVANSTQAPGVITANGSPAASDNTVTLVAASLPPSQFGFFLNSMSQGFVPGPGGIQGNLCLSGAIGRYNAAGQVLNSGASGGFQLTLDLTSTPTPSGPISIAGGQTWHFQCWYRDSNPGPTSNFTSAVTVCFQ